MRLVSHSTDQTRRLGTEIGRAAQPGDVVLLVGTLGAGKTCLAQGIAWGLGIEGYATSPSFIIVNRYQGRLDMFHIDLFRLERLDEVADLGLDDYLRGEGICVVEWADRAMALLPEEHLLIEMAITGEATRDITLTPHGGRYRDLLARLDVAERARG